MQRKDRLGRPVSWSDMLFHGKGTANEPMPSARDIMLRPNAQKSIKAAYNCGKLIKKYIGKKKKVKAS